MWFLFLLLSQSYVPLPKLDCPTLEDSAATPYLETACLATACGHLIPLNQDFPPWSTHAPSPSPNLPPHGLIG